MSNLTLDERNKHLLRIAKLKCVDLGAPVEKHPCVVSGGSHEQGGAREDKEG